MKDDNNNSSGSNDEWYKVEFMVRKLGNMHLESFIHDIKLDVDVELGRDFDYRNLMVYRRVSDKQEDIKQQ